MFTALGQVPAARLWFALAEIVFFFGCMAAYVQIRRWPRRIPLVAGLLAVLAATDLAYHFPPLFAVLNLLGSRAELAGQELTSSLYRRLLLDPQVLAMVAHVWLAAVAVTGVVVMRLAAAADHGSADAQLPPENQPRTTVAIAARWALAASLAQMPVGLWLLLAVPAPSRGSLMGDDIAGTGLFVLAIVATFGLLHHLAAAAQGDTAPAQVRRSLALTVGIVLLMTAALDRSRVRDPDRADRFTSARRFSQLVCPQRGWLQLGWPHSGWAPVAADVGSTAPRIPWHLSCTEENMSRETIVLADSGGSTQARIMPALGMNCYGFRVALAGQPVEVLWADPDFAGGEKRPTRSGIPILFPFAGRIGGAKYQYAGREYQLTPSDPLGSAIHGFVVHRPWHVVGQTADSVTGEFQAAVDDPALLEHWPADFRLRVTYRVAPGTLRGECTIENPDHRPLPCGIGFHGYYRLPLGPEPSAAECRVQVPVGQRGSWPTCSPRGTAGRAPPESN